MADGYALILHVRHLMTKHLIDETHTTGHVHPGSVSQRNTRTLLAAMLQRIEPEVCHFRNIFGMGIDAIDATFFFPFRF